MASSVRVGRAVWRYRAATASVVATPYQDDEKGESRAHEARQVHSVKYGRKCDVRQRLQQRAPERELPIVFVTARDQELDRILGFELGAADYVVKPFSLQELVLRVGALLRRTQAATGENIIDLPPLRVDLACERVTVEGRPVELSHIEFQILRTLASPPGRVRTREEILRAVWGDASSVFDRTVDAHLARLRRRLGSASERVRTLRGAGYKLA